MLGLEPVQSRREVLLPPGAGSIRVLHAISPTVVPRPNDWPPEAILTGYWLLDQQEDYVPPVDLARFLDAGPPPVYVGFGSMTSGDPEALRRIVVDALRRADVRGIISSGWARIDGTDTDNTITIPAVPHGWLFPRMAAVVHHGGAGTTAQGFRSGVPCVICPFIGDQPGWAEKSVALGIGAPPVPRKRLTAERLAQSIRLAVNDPDLRENAEALARKLRDEDGVAVAIAAIEESLKS